MERLTVPAERLLDGRSRIQVVDARLVKEHAMEFYWRLKEYEDTGLSPEDVADLMASHAMAICELAKMPKWIPAKEPDLPKEFVSVLVCIPSDDPLPTVKEAYLADGMWVTKAAYYTQQEVTHWRPMPKGVEEHHE